MVVSIISLLMGILVPVVRTAKDKARAIVSTSNQKQITSGVNVFALDNDENYPASVATVGFGTNWNWSDPTKLAGNRQRTPSVHRSMGAYLGSYIPLAKTMSCPKAPHQYKYLEQAWNAGDEWDNPETSFSSDPVGGTYCFYWNYVGNLGASNLLFRGPRGPAGSRKYSKLLVSDYFGFSHWRSPDAYGSCDQFEGAGVTEETWLLSSYWSGAAEPDAPKPDIQLRAGYTDGHVETYSTSDVVPMKVSITSDGTVPYPDDVGPGVFYLPGNALR